MSIGIAAFIAGLGTGAMQQMRYQDEQDRQKKKDAMEEETHNAQMDDVRRKKKMQDELAAAGTDATVTPAAGVTGLSTPGNETQYADPDVAASDVRQGKRMAETTGTEVPAVKVAPKFAANGVNFDSESQAQGAANVANTQGGKEKRQAAVLAKYDPAAAAQLRAANAQATNAEQAIADRAVRDRLTSMSSFEDLAHFISETPADGQKGGLKVQPVLNPDKTVSFAKVNADGTTTPLPGSYANTELGLEQARMKVAGYSTPEMRMAHYQWQTAQDQHAKEFEETKQIQKDQLAELTKHNRATEQNANALTAVHQQTLQFQKDKARLDDPTYNLPPAVKLQTQALQKQVLNAQEQLAKAMANDPNWDENSKGAMALKGQIAAANLKVQALVTQYIPAPKGAPAAAADPAGLRTAPAPGQPPAAAAPKPMAAQGVSVAAPATADPVTAGAAPAVPILALPDAQQAFSAAQTKLAAYGLRQRQADPQGFAQAQAGAAVAKAALEAAQAQAAADARRSFASASGPAFVAPQP